MFTSPSQILCTIFGVNIYYYGVIMALAIATGVLVADWAGTKYFGLKKETIIDLAPYIIIFGILGARIYYCALNYGFYLRFPTEIIAIRHGGISIHGAMLGGALGLWLFAKRHKLNPIKLCDTSVIGLSIAQAIGRWGNFFNSEAFGLPYNGFLKLYIPPSDRPAAFMNYEYFHPAFLYESILDLVIFVILFFIYKRYNVKRPGFTLAMYLILYSVARFAVEQIRIDSALNISGIPVAQIISGVIFAVGIVMLFFVFKRVKI